MSQLVLDDQLDVRLLVPILGKRWAVERLQKLPPGELILDDRVPAILAELDQPSFLTIDADFWDRELCHADYAIVYFALTKDQQALIPVLLRALFPRPEFRTKAARRGKVARVSTVAIDYWQLQDRDVHHIDWQPVGRGSR